MRRPSRCLALCALAASVLADGAGALRAQDTVTLETGDEVTGRVVFVSDERVVVRDGGKDRELDRAQVRQIDWLRGHLETLLDRAARIPADSVAGNLDLARFAASNGLPGEARLFYWRVLFVDPENVEAHEGLEHRLSKNRWLIEHERRSYDLAGFREAISEWRRALRLTTTHFNVATNLELEAGVELALDLERLYLAFYAAFGSDFALYECTAPMHAEVHADAKSFPESASAGRAYFSRQPNVLFVDASRELERYALAHESTHQLLYTATVLEANRSGDLPAWLDEGLAEYVAASVVREGPIALEPGFPHRGHFNLHATAKKPLSLSRVLALQRSDFINSSRLQEMYAQSYSLVHWCLHAEDGARRPAFFAYVRATFEGRASPSRFKKDLDLPRDFEEVWHAYATVEAQE